MQKKDEFIKLYCFGCGLELQNDNPDKPGYVPKSLEATSKYLCKRCFRLQHYGDLSQETPYSIEYKTIIARAKKERALIVYVVDLFAFESSLIDSFLDEIKDERVVLIATKRDVIPASVKDEKLQKFLKERMEELDIKPIYTEIVSAINNYNIEKLVEHLNKLRKGKSVYVFGATSVGKSSLINAFLKCYENDTTQMITISPYPGTTLDVINVPLKDGKFVYDTPGILQKNSIFAHLDKKLVKYVLPRKEIKVRGYQLRDKQSLMIENLAKLDILDSGRLNVSLYLSNDLNVYRSKLDNSEKVFNNMILNKQFKHIDRNIKSLEDLECHELTLPNGTCDVVVSGLVWAKVKGEGQAIRLYVPKNVQVSVRSCKI